MIIEVHSITKRYSSLVAVDDISFNVEQGQVFALLGHNGAGKTTLIKMICSLIRPTSGTICLNGYHVFKQRGKAMQQIGVVLEGARNIYWRLSAWENLMYFGQLKGVSGNLLKERAESLLKLFDLWERRNHESGDFSRGMQQKLAIAAALIADPPILLLDEPTLGLDVQAAHTLRQKIIQLANEQGKTIIITSHQLDMVQDVCHQIAVIKKGKLIANKPIAKLLRFYAQEQFVIEVEGQINRDSSPLFASLDVRLQDGRSRISGFGDDQTTLNQLVNLIHSMNLPLISVQRTHPSLEDTFIRLTNT